MSVLYTKGKLVSGTIAEFQSYDAILHSPRFPKSLVQLLVTDSGTLDLSRQLGRADSLVTMKIGDNLLLLAEGGNRAEIGGRQ